MSTTTTTQPVFHDTPGYDPRHFSVLHYRQAVRIGDRVEISGQGGWDDETRFPASVEDEIVRAFDNVERTLAEAGATFADVYALESWHLTTSGPVIDEEHTRVMAAQLRERFSARAPIWTQLGVAALGAPGMRVELRVSALVGARD